MLVAIGLVAVIAVLVYVYLVWTFGYWRDRNVLGPKPSPLFGNYPSMITMKQHITDDIAKIYKEYKGKASFVGTFSLRSPRLLLLEPELVKTVLVKNFKNFHDSDFSDMFDKESDPILGRNPFILTGDEWKEKRAEITPAFTATRIKALLPLIEEVAERMVLYLRKPDQSSAEAWAAGGVNARELAAKFTTDAVSSCIYAIDAGSFTQEKPAIREMGRKLMGTGFKFFLIMAVNTFFPSLKKYKKFSFITKDVEFFFIDLINQAIKYRKDNNISRNDYLEHLLQLKEKKGLSDVDLTAHSISFFVDGFETSSLVMSHTLHQLAKHPQVQQRLREEIIENTGENGKIPYETLTEMPYLDQVFNETLRICPPGSFLSKLCTEEIELEGLKEKPLKIEKGTVVWLPLYSIQTDPAYYDDPLSFNPDRFAPENGGVKPFQDQSLFFPFGDGPRICLGMRFAKCQAKVGITEIIRHFELSVNAKTSPENIFDPKEFMLSPKGGIWLNVKPLDN